MHFYLAILNALLYYYNNTRRKENLLYVFTKDVRYPSGAGAFDWLVGIRAI